MFETEKKLTKATSIAGRNTMQGSYKTIGNELLPDQTQHNLFLKEPACGTAKLHLES